MTTSASNIENNYTPSDSARRDGDESTPRPCPKPCTTESDIKSLEEIDTPFVQSAPCVSDSDAYPLSAPWRDGDDAPRPKPIPITGVLNRPRRNPAKNDEGDAK